MAMMSDHAFGRILQYYKRLEWLIALLAVQHGERHEGGYRIVLQDEDLSALERALGTDDPVVMVRRDHETARYVIDVL